MRLTRVRGVPLAGEALGFGELGGGHALCNCISDTHVLLRFFIGGLRGG